MNLCRTYLQYWRHLARLESLQSAYDVTVADRLLSLPQ
jgi:hypothetical protein